MVIDVFVFISELYSYANISETWDWFHFVRCKLEKILQNLHSFKRCIDCRVMFLLVQVKAIKILRSCFFMLHWCLPTFFQFVFFKLWIVLMASLFTYNKGLTKIKFNGSIINMIWDAFFYGLNITIHCLYELRYCLLLLLRIFDPFTLAIACI